MAGRAYPKRTHLKADSISFEAKKGVITATLFSALMLLCIIPLQPSKEIPLDGLEPAESSGRGEVYDGDWAMARQQKLDYCYQDVVFAVDDSSDFLVLSTCLDYSFSVYMHSDWNVLLETVETGIQVENAVLSPDGEYLVIYSDAYFEIYQTSDWSHVFSDDLISDGSSSAQISDVTWSGDGERIVLTSGASGNKMYEGPDWEEVTGPTSSATWVVHHPAEDILWYVASDGSGNEYEFENIPFVGYQWVMKRSFNLRGYAGPFTSNSDGSMLLMSGDYEVSAYSTSDYSELFVSQWGAVEGSFSNGDASIVYYSNEEYYIVSTDTWQVQTSFVSQEQGYYDDGPFDIVFSSEDDEIIVSSEFGYDHYLSSWSPDEDSDGVADLRDICPYTSEDEDADAKGCAPSQKDTDLDGVNDRDDMCPRTATSDIADSNGCSPPQLQDTDGDGVSDSDDFCPGTLPNEFSNIYGCSSNQRDVDGDGLVDAQDNCPLYDVESCPNIISWSMASEPLDDSVSSSLQWSPAGGHAVTQISDGIRLIDETFMPVREHLFENESQSVRDYLWMPNGVDLLIIWESNYWDDSECGYYFWDTVDDTLSTSYLVNDDCYSIQDPTLSPDGARLAVSKVSESYSGSILMIDLTTHEVAFEDEDHFPRELIFTHDGTSLVGLTSRVLNLWDANDGYLLQSRSIEDAEHLLLSPDGDCLYAYSEETIRVYSMDSFTFKSMVTFDDDNAHIYSEQVQLSLEFSRSGDLLYAMSVNVSYDGDWYANSSMRTYFIDDDGSLELALSPQIVNTSIGIPIFFPQQTSFITYVDDFNDYHEEGYYLWSPDSDGDGIGDTSDLCPGTNLNEFSDEDGCSWEQLDDDEDGIFNGQDLCTGTMYQALIDENGCSDAQVDKDSDGVCDQGALSVGPSGCQGIDLCPNTLPGNVANAAGCSWGQQDEDDDDVPNGVDVCPDTGLDDDANADGCGEKQRDSDSDLLNDYWDQCPLTASNSSVDEIGCSDLQVDADLDSVCDSGSPSAGPSNCTGIDICPETGENQTVNADGCSWNQTDDDGDGIRNMDDSCPDTIEAEISPDGCSSWQRDSDDDGISDALDKCAKTPENEFSNQEGCSQSQGQSEVKSDGSDLFSGATLVLIGAFVLGLMVLSGFFLRSRNEPELLQQSANQDPPYQTRGAMRDDGKEWIEFPEGSGNMYYRDSTSGQWVKDQ